MDPREHVGNSDPVGASVLSVNVGRPEPDRHRPNRLTGIDKRPAETIEVFAPGPKGAVGRASVSGVRGDFVGDARHHGGDYQAVYAYAAEDLAFFGDLMGRRFPPGSFGENLTTAGLDVSGARIGERWRVGDIVEVQVRAPRIPCNTFRAWIDERGWLPTFTAAARPGAYLSVVTPGVIHPGDPIAVVFRPLHDVTIELLFRSQTTDPSLAPLVLTARDHLIPESLDLALRAGTFTIG